MLFVLEKDTPYEACVEPYQHVAPRGATGSRAFTRVFIFSVSPAPLFKAPRAPEGIVESTATHGGPQGQRHSASRPRRARSSPPRQLDANASRPPAPPGSNATRLQRHQAPTPPGSSATSLQRHQPPTSPGSSATRLQRHQAPAPPGSNATRLQRHLARGSG